MDYQSVKIYWTVESVLKSPDGCYERCNSRIWTVSDKYLVDESSKKISAYLFNLRGAFLSLNYWIIYVGSELKLQKLHIFVLDMETRCSDAKVPHSSNGVRCIEVL